MRFIVSFLIFISTASTVQAQLRRVETMPQRANPERANSELARITAASGIFDLKISKNMNSCRITLWSDGPKGKYPVSMPAGCHKAFPAVLSKVRNWTLGDDGAIDLRDETGGVQIEFHIKEGKLVSDTITEQIYELKPADTGWFKRQIAAVSSSKPSSSLGDMVNAGQVAGIYTISREKGKSSDCKITLLTQPGAKSGSMKAVLDERCQDRGMQIFSPNAWQTDGSKLILLSRKGHGVNLLRIGSTGWIKEKSTGEPLELLKQ